jgi:hypothetical protein
VSSRQLQTLSKVPYDDGIRIGEPPHWGWTDSDGKTWKIYRTAQWGRPDKVSQGKATTKFRWTRPGRSGKKSVTNARVLPLMVSRMSVGGQFRGEAFDANGALSSERKCFGSSGMPCTPAVAFANAVCERRPFRSNRGQPGETRSCPNQYQSHVVPCVRSLLQSLSPPFCIMEEAKVPRFPVVSPRAVLLQRTIPLAMS